MSHVIKTLLGGAAAAIMLATAASAGTISVATNELQTADGQDFLLSLTGLAPSDGTGGLLKVYARGDYEENISSIDEFLTVDVEGLFSAGPIGGFDVDNPGVGVGGPFDFFNRFDTATDVEFQRTFTLDGTTLDALLADGQVDVGINLSDGVDFFNETARVNVILQYEADMAAVPLPASLPMLLAGLGGVAALRRRKKAD